LETAKRAFEALAEPDRVALQDGLIWTGDYKGLSDGKFGKGTRDAIMAFATRSKLPADGTLDAKGRAALAAAAKQTKEAVQFALQTDAKTALRIGLPLKLLTRVKPLPSGTRYSSADESVSLETSTRAGTPAGLPELFATVIAEVPGRKVTYKILRPDFFVAAGEAQGAAFYTKMVRGERAGTASLVGYTFTYPIAMRARLDPISVAISNSFVAFPDAAAIASTVPTSNSTVAPAAANGEPALAKLVLTASGIAITPDLIVTSLPKSCSDPQIGTKKAKILKQAETDGLTLLSLPAAASGTFPLRPNDPTGTAQVVVLSFTPRTASDSALTGASGDLQKGEAEVWRLLAPVQNPVAGAAVLDRSGALAGLVPTDAVPGKAIAGILPQTKRNVIPASKLAAFLSEARPKPSEHIDAHTTGEIAALGGAAMVAIYCTR
jgi:peptidoglycan hydrolase-like protein with peptidoglycan-binding domain